MDKAVILARGLGTRMREVNGAAVLTHDQSDAADAGIKALIPADRPFLDYVLGALAEAAYKRICLVIAPEHDALRTYYGKTLDYKRISVEFAIQVEPLGTADAVAAAEDFAGDDPFLTINSDDYYPVEALRALRELDEPGIAAFERDSMLSGRNIPLERLTQFAVVEMDNEGYLTKIIEKPDEETIRTMPEPVCVSMNCWRFDSAIFQACRAISPSPRGEFEITDAVQHVIDSVGHRFRVLTFKAAVLGLTSRADIAAVEKMLRGTQVLL